MADRCEYGLPLDPPAQGDYLRPCFEQPDADISTVVRNGEHPNYRRAVRADGGRIERGASVDGTGTSGLIPWKRVGRCWTGTQHPVVAVDHG